MNEVDYSQIGKIANNGDNKFSLQDAKGIEQSRSSLDLSNTSRLGRWIFESGANAANRTAAKIGKQFDPVTRGEYDQYLVKRTIKAWEESCDTLHSACKFSRWIGWAYFKFMFQFGNKLKELLKLSAPEEALKKGMPPEAFFAWQNILSFNGQKISIANENTTDKLQLSYDPQGGLTVTSNNEIPVKITTISSVESNDTLFCLHTENEQEILVKKTDLLTIGLNLKGKVPLGQFFKDNNVPSFEDRAIIFDDGTAIKLSYDANSKFKEINDGISLCTLKYNFSMNYGLSKLNVNFLENGDVCLSYDQNKEAATFKMRDLRNLVNQLRKTETKNNLAQKEVPINQFFRKQNAAPRRLDDLYIKLNQSINPQFSSVLITRYGDSCVDLMMTAFSGQKFFTQNVQIKDNPNSDVVEISGQYWDTDEKRWENFNITVNRAQLLRYKHNDKTVPNWPTEIRLVNFLWRNDAFPPGNQTRTLTAIQLGVPDKKNHNQEVQIKIDHNGDVCIGDNALRDTNIYRDKSCSEEEAIITGFDKNAKWCKCKVKIDDLLGHTTALEEESLSKKSNTQGFEDRANVTDNKENKTNDTNSVPKKSHKSKSDKKNNYTLDNLPEEGVSFRDFLKGKDKIFTGQCSESFEAMVKLSNQDTYPINIRFSMENKIIFLEEQVETDEWKRVSSSDQSFKLLPVESDQDADKNKIKFRFGPNTNNRNRSFEVDKDTLQQILFPESNSAE